MSEIQINKPSQKISITRRKHKEKKVFLVQFPFSREIYKRCKQLGGCYTRTYKGWWWPAEEMSEEQLRIKLAIHTSPQDKKKTIDKDCAWMYEKFTSEIEEKISEMERWMKQKRYSENTINTYLSFVRQFFGKHPVLHWDGITQSLITQYNYDEFIVKKKSYSTQNQWINAIKVYLKVHKLELEELKDIERPRKSKHLPDVLTQEEVQSIFQHTKNLKHRTLLMLIYSCGLRIGETLNIQPADIKSAEGLIYIRGGKGKKDRRVPLSKRILEQLRRYYRSYTPNEYLFEGQKGGQYSNTSAAKVLQRAVKKAGIKKRVTLHTLRHSYATHLTNRGVNIQYLQEILGHNNPKTTMLYTHLSGKDIRNIKSPLDDMEI